MENRQRLMVAAAVLLVAQVVHGAVPADTSAEGYVGLVVGLSLLVATVAGLVGAAQRMPWAPGILLGTGAFVAVGFVLYHAVPVTSPVTNPYPGQGVGAAPWLTVVASVVAVFGLSPSPPRPPPPPTG
jgi:hypothetical protein